MKFKRRNVEALAYLVCGNPGSYDPAAGEEPKYFLYRSSSYTTGGAGTRSAVSG
jgi:hypothetical protein